MSPTLALQSGVFLFYLTTASALLAAGGGILAALRWGLRANVAHAWRAYCGWLFMVPVLLLGYYLGREVAIVMLTAVAVIAFHEFARATELRDDRVLTGVVHAGIVVTGMACLIPGNVVEVPARFLSLPVFVIAAILAVPVLRNRGQGQLRLLGLAILGFVLFGWMFGHVAFLANSAHAYGYLGFLVVAVELNDVAAYVFGKWLGRHPLRSNISPKKTWEGAIGALAVSLVLPWLLLPTLPHFDAKDCIAVGLIVGIGGQLGDLVVSVLKRDLGLKDMGALIPGHGGILDRIDSLIYVAPLFFHYVWIRHEMNVGVL